MLPCMRGSKKKKWNADSGNTGIIRKREETDPKFTEVLVHFDGSFQIRWIILVNRIIQRTNIRIRTHSIFFENENFNVNKVDYQSCTDYPTYNPSEADDPYVV